ncbi:MAG: pentapeptide repeat-containing protein [Chloroflexi bacterium]|nr:pentapeptide repeat-containing protein [Chloroflexota bacterium]
MACADLSWANLTKAQLNAPGFAVTPIGETGGITATNLSYATLYGLTSAGQIWRCRFDWRESILCLLINANLNGTILAGADLTKAI